MVVTFSSGQTGLILLRELYLVPPSHIIRDTHDVVVSMNS